MNVVSNPKKIIENDNSGDIIFTHREQKTISISMPREVKTYALKELLEGRAGGG
jgi:hypothetical protein